MASEDGGVSLMDEMIREEPKPSPNLEQIIAEESVAVEITDSGEVKPLPQPEIDDRIFNPEIHQPGPDGRGVLRKDGSGRYARKRGPRGGGSGGSKSPTQVSDAGGNAEKQAAKEMAAAFFTVSMGIFGPEWKPQIDPNTGIGEREVIENAFEEYFRTSGIVKMPPSIALLTTLGFYGIVRWDMPQTKERRKKLWELVYEKSASMVRGVIGFFKRR